MALDRTARAGHLGSGSLGLIGLLPSEFPGTITVSRIGREVLDAGSTLIAVNELEQRLAH